MKFIFPQNYDFKNKILGIIDYSTAIINVIWYAFVYLIINIFNINLKIKIFIFVLFCFPFFLISVIGFTHENFLSVLIYFFKYLKSKKIYLYK